MHNVCDQDTTAFANRDAIATCDCDTDPIACLEKMFVNVVQLGRIQRGQAPARRPVFVRTHGVVHGHFVIQADLPENLRIGIFGASKTYTAWVRFSADPFGMTDLKSTVGIGIKLFGVEGTKLVSPNENAATADFILQNMDVFFVDSARDMCAFTKAALTGTLDTWLKDHPETQKILDEMQKVVPTALGTEYWSVIPFRFGDTHYCKYKIEPEMVPAGPTPDFDDPSYLAADLLARLAKGEARFRFLVQLRTDDAAMPLDQAMVRWSELASRPIHVATLILPQQNLAARGQVDYGEGLSFNPWRTIHAHEPVGSIAAARKVVYEASARLRRNVNGETIGEPTEFRPDTEWPAGKDSLIVRAAIYPGIGIARIGDSTAEGQDGYYIGPEVTEPPQTKFGQNRDKAGAIKRQAARFRIYGYNAAGEVVAELNSLSSLAPNITWKVHLANKKAAWYQFTAALDIPEEAGLSVVRRNKDVKGGERKSLIIDPGPRTIDGVNQSGTENRFDSGKFQETPVVLGEIRTDDAGRLLVLGGYGHSGSPSSKPIYDPSDPNSFANADGWFDDISDGPVTATLTLNGREIPVDPAWVVVAPPNFAPDIIGWRTLYDLLVDGYVQDGRLPFPERVSFSRDVLPVLRRLSNLQWVNKGFASMFGKGNPFDFDDPGFIQKLAHRPVSSAAPDSYRELRQQVYNAFRPANTAANDPRTWPWIYGDAFGSFDSSPRSNLALSEVRAKQLELWVEGRFESDWDPSVQPPDTLTNVPLNEQPDMLNRAALHFCVADAFHPGCEVTWPMRHSTLYSEPFRIRHRSLEEPETDYGKTLSADAVRQPGGPLYGQGPGDLSRWMALPWQADTAFCRSGYEPKYDPYLPTFWPARVPNQVLTEGDYSTVIDSTLPREPRIAAYNNRKNWLRGFTGPVADQMLKMVEGFGKMGIVEARDGVAGDPDFPEVLYVEGLPPHVVEDLERVDSVRTESIRSLAVDTQLEAISPEQRRLVESGWESAEQLEEARRLRGFRNP